MRIDYLEETGGDNYGLVTETKLTGSYDEIKDYYLKNKKQEYHSISAGGDYETYGQFAIYDDKNRNITANFKVQVEAENSLDENGKFKPQYMQNIENISDLQNEKLKELENNLKSKSIKNSDIDEILKGISAENTKEDLEKKLEIYKNENEHIEGYDEEGYHFRESTKENEMRITGTALSEYYKITKKYEKIAEYDPQIKSIMQGQNMENLKEQEPIQQKDSKGWTIKITAGENFDPKLAKILEDKQILNKIHQGEEAQAIFQVVNEIDQGIKKSGFDKNEFPKSKLNFEIQTGDNNRFDLAVPMGRDLFKDGDLKQFINVSLKDIDKPAISEKDMRDFSKFFDKKNGEYVNKVDNKIFDRAIDGGIASLSKSLESIGDENISAFTQAFTSAYGLGRSHTPTSTPTKVKSNEITPQELENMKKLKSEAYANINKSKDKEKEIAKSTDLGQSM